MNQAQGWAVLRKAETIVYFQDRNVRQNHKKSMNDFAEQLEIEK
jgi:hypothetical protein